MSDDKTIKTTYSIDFSLGDRVKGLTPEKQRDHAEHLMREALETGQRIERPTAILTGGQPGSGKSAIVDGARAQFEGKGGAIVIDPDEIRPTLPYMKERMERGDLDIPNEANVDAGTIAYQMVQIAKREGRNVVIDGTLQNTKRALDLAGEMRDAGYDVQFHGMAVHPDLSHARTYSRREEQIAQSPTAFGRGVSDEFHDQAVEGYKNTVDAFQAKAAVNSMTFYGPAGKIAETRFENGQWTPDISMKERMEQEQRHPDLKARMAASDSWWAAARAMNARGAPSEEIEKVKAFGSFSSLHERQLRATTVKASITMPPQAPSNTVESSKSHDLTNESLRSLAALVHAGVKMAGKDADQSIMTVNWTDGEAYLDVRAPGPRGYERHVLPFHEKVEAAISKVAKDGTLEVDYAKESAKVRDLPMRTLEAKAMGLGLEANDFGAVAAPALRERENAHAKGAVIAAIMAGRVHQR